MAAARNLADQAALKEMALSDSMEEIRVEAVKRMTDETALANLAANGRWGAVRDAAKSRLSILSGRPSGRLKQGESGIVHGKLKP